MRELLLFLSVFTACAVEAVEALTIVLAVGTTRGWRSVWCGVGAAAGALAAFVVALGPALAAIPLDGLRLAVGGLLLIFGLQWLRKAILRAGGIKALHDEDAIYLREADAAQVAAHTGRGIVTDWYSFTIAFKGVLLEGLEVAFIVVTFGTNQRSVPVALAGALAAIAVVAAAGVLVHRPLSRVPENTLKFAVGVLLTSFGTFWAAEGAGARWPGEDAALLGLILAVAAVALSLVAALRRRRTAQPLAVIG